MPNAITRAKYLAAGLCPMCGREQDISNSTSCSRCLARLSLQSIKRRADQKALLYNLDLSWLLSNTPTNCPCCGIIMQRGQQGTSPSVDRKNNALGYSPDNCWIICFKCNKLKSDYPSSDALRKAAHDMLRIASLLEFDP